MLLGTKVNDGPSETTILDSMQPNGEAKQSKRGVVEKCKTVSKVNKVVVDFNIPIFAAIVLYHSFRHVKEWPAIFVQAYAEDYFNNRLWVDDSRCEKFVLNLRSVLETDKHNDNDGSSQKFLQKLVGKYGKWLEESNLLLLSKLQKSANTHNIHSLNACPDTNMSLAKPSISSFKNTSNSRVVPNENLNAINSDSDSGEEIIEEASSSILLLQTPNEAEPPKHRDSKDSVNDCIDPKPVIDAQYVESSDSSDDEGEEVLLEEAGFSSTIPNNEQDGHSREDNKSLFDAVFAIDSGLDEIRSRFHGTNRTVSIGFIEESLKRRLNSRAKHSNTGLLTCLPDFLSNIPEVRVLVASHLEKWLQSPALADLARSLFSKVIDSLSITETPLKQDLHVITLILSMKLKSNQVIISELISLRGLLLNNAFIL